MLFTPSIVEDYGKLFLLNLRWKTLEKKTQGNFDNKQSKSTGKGMMQSTRWLNKIW